MESLNPIKLNPYLNSCLNFFCSFPETFCIFYLCNGMFYFVIKNIKYNIQPYNNKSFPRRFNVESMWCVCREVITNFLKRLSSACAILRRRIDNWQKTTVHDSVWYLQFRFFFKQFFSKFKASWPVIAFQECNYFIWKGLDPIF